MQYIFPDTMEIRDETTMPRQIGSTFVCGRSEWLKTGWREVKSRKAIPDGFRVPDLAWKVAINDGEFATLTFADSDLVNIAAEQAAQAAARAAAELAAKERAALDSADTLLGKVLVALINKRLAADKQITRTECIAEARKQLGLI